VNVSSGLSALADIPSDSYRQQVQSAESLDALRAISFAPDDAGCRASVGQEYQGIAVPVYRCHEHPVLQGLSLHALVFDSHYRLHAMRC
jgi:hypothetical protein